MEGATIKAARTRMKYQYSLRLALPEKLKVFLSAFRYQIIAYTLQCVSIRKDG
jgi:hypothetical protein